MTPFWNMVWCIIGNQQTFIELMNVTVPFDVFQRKSCALITFPVKTIVKE